MEDYDERLNQVSYFDELGENMNNTGNAMLGVGDALTKIADGDGYEDDTRRNVKDQVGTFEEFMKNVRNLGSGTMLHTKSIPDLTIDDVSRGVGKDNNEWMKSYRDAVNNRRIDLLAQVLNNCDGNKILMSVGDIDNIKSSIVSTLLQRRLTGDISIGKSVLKYDAYYERVQVDM